MKKENGAVSSPNDGKRSCSETQWLTRGSAVHASERDYAKIVKSSPSRKHIRRVAAIAEPSRAAIAGPPPLQPRAPPDSTVPREQQQVCPATCPDRVRRSPAPFTCLAQVKNQQRLHGLLPAYYYG